VSNCCPCLLAHSILNDGHISSIETTWLALFPVSTQLTSSTNNNPSASDTYSFTHLIGPGVSIAKRIVDTGEPGGTFASTGCHFMALPSNIISTILSDRSVPAVCLRSPSISLTFIQLSSHPLANLGKATLMTLRTMPVMWPHIHAA